MAKSSLIFPKEVTANHVVAAARKWDSAGQQFKNFRKGLVYAVRIKGKSYPPKAISSIAHELATGRALSTRQLKGAKEGTWHRRLKQLGFEIVKKHHETTGIAEAKNKSPVFTLLWHDKELAGYADLLPESWFFKDGSLFSQVHIIKGPRQDVYKAKCNVKVSGARAELDYEPFAKFNREQDNYLGITRIQFQGVNRARIKQIFWKDKGRKSFVPCITTIGYENPEGLMSEQDIDLLGMSAVEGRKKLVTHLKRERSAGLVAMKKAAILNAGHALACEACGFTFKDQYGKLGETYCEAHHEKPLSESGVVINSLRHLRILCSNCHRMIHLTNPIMSVEKFRKKYLRK